MGTLFSAFDIARSGMQVAQAQLDIAGHNIANVNKPGFSRQRVELISRLPVTKPFGQIGRGVEIADIVRVRDTFLDGLFRREAAGLGDATVRAEFLQRIEDVFLEPSEHGLSSRINGFFNALAEFANNVEELPVRESVIAEAEALTQLFHDTAGRLNTLRTQANQELIHAVPEINSLASQIAALNFQIRQLEVGGKGANDLRDDRDLLLDQLSKLVNISVHEGQSGQISVLIGDAELISGDIVNEIEAVVNPALDAERLDLVELRFANSGALVPVSDGEVFAALQVRDEVLVQLDGRIDTLAATIIREINRVHSQGTGLVNYSAPVTSEHAVTGAAVPLDTAGLPFTFSAGTFDFNRYDSAGNLISTSTVTITPGVTTLNDIAAALGANGSVVNGQLVLTPPAGGSFSLTNDTSGVLGALGVNGLFTGTDARTIGINSAIAANPALLASGFSNDPLNTGDNTAALALADVQDGLFLDGGASSINDHYETTVAQLGIDARANAQRLQVEQTFVDNVAQRRQQVSGVSIDEEVTLLLQFQRAFEASARVVTVTDRMLDSLMNMAL